MGFRLLGPVEVWAGPQRLEIGPPRQRAVVAALAVDAGRLVTADTLVHRVWGPDPPVRAHRTLHTYIARFRRTTGQLSTAGGRPVRVVREPGGYLLDVDGERVDLFRFRRLVALAADPDRPDRERLGLLRDALDMWRGEPLAGVPGDWAQRTRQAWRQQHIEAVMAWAHTLRRVGDPAAAVPALTELVAEHPLHEPLSAALVRSLGGAGRLAAALEHYTQTRRRLVEELGAEPGPELRAAHQVVLRGDPEPPPDSPPDAGSGPMPAPAIPAQLPPDVSGFTGRRAELERLDALLAREESGDQKIDPPDPEPTFVVISAVSGTAGVGKTALAIRWAHRMKRRFPDGQLYVNLRGYDPEYPMTPSDALAGFLGALGVAEHDIPLTLDDRTARYRTLVAGRRMLVVLDNAAAAEQVRPLLPGAPECAVLVTSRDALTGLVARDGARRVDLDTLPVPDALDLLHELIGDRTAAEPEAAAELAEQCANLPLALRVAAELAATRPADPLADLVTELHDRQHRLDLLDAGGDPRTAVTAVFSWSIQHLPAWVSRTFALLGLHPGPDVDDHAAAAMAGIGLAEARDALSRLARAHLMHHAGSGRYGMHDLLRAYAAGLATAKDGDDGAAAAALGRLYDHLLATAASAMDTLFPADAARRPRPPEVAGPIPRWTDPQAAMAWLDTELPTLTAVTVQTAAGDRPAGAGRLAAILSRYLDEGGHHTAALIIHQNARNAARRVADRAGEAVALLDLGGLLWQLGDYDLATSHVAEALALFRAAGDDIGTARALGNLGIIELRRGRYGPAIGFSTQAWVMYQEAGDARREIPALLSLGAAEGWLGRYDVATEHLSRALSLAHQHDAPSVAYALATLGDVATAEGRYESAVGNHRQALALFRQFANQTGEAWALDSLGTVHTRLGECDAAAGYHAQALALFRQIGDRDGEPWALNGLGEAATGAGRHGEALARHKAALDGSTATGNLHQQARAYAGLAEAHRGLGAAARAEEHELRALALFTELGTPEADQLRASRAHRDCPDRGETGLPHRDV